MRTSIKHINQTDRIKSSIVCANVVYENSRVCELNRLTWSLHKSNRPPD